MLKLQPTILHVSVTACIELNIKNNEPGENDIMRGFGILFALKGLLSVNVLSSYIMYVYNSAVFLR